MAKPASVLLPPPPRGFCDNEILGRITALQQLMHQQRWDAVWLCTEHDIRYYTGFHSQFWHSLTRPWFVIIPQNGETIAVIPSIGAAGMAGTPVQDIRCWSSPNPDDDGVSLLRQSLNDLPRRYGRLGVPLGTESFLKMPQADFVRLQDGLAFDIVDAQPLLWQQRLVKSTTEIAKIHFCADITACLMHDLPRYVQGGQTQRQICQTLRRQVIAAGLDSSPFLIAGAGTGGYADIIMGPDDSVPQVGDIMIIDTGSQYDGYFCDFDRNYVFGTVSDQAKAAHERLWQATEFVLTTLRPNMSCRAIAEQLSTLLDPHQARKGNIGRVGHGLGMGLTEWPSLHPDYDIPLPVGAVMTLEPALWVDDQHMLVHEENIVVTESGAQLLSRRTPEDLLVIET